MNIERELDRMIGVEIEDWKARKHEAVFRAEAETSGEVMGMLTIDGKPFRPGCNVANHWTSLTEARKVALRLGSELRVA